MKRSIDIPIFNYDGVAMDGITVKKAIVQALGHPEASKTEDHKTKLQLDALAMRLAKSPDPVEVSIEEAKEINDRVTFLLGPRIVAAVAEALDPDILET